jgi:hypothetical protein
VVIRAVAQLWDVRPHYTSMKKSRILFSICLALAACGCHLQAADTVPSGSFRLVVSDMAKDETFRIASLKILSLQSGRFSVGTEGEGRAYGDFSASPTDKLQEGRVLFIASRMTDSRTTNAYILARLQATGTGKDGNGGMLFQSSFEGMYYPSLDTKLAEFANMTAKDGIYPLDTPLEIGQIDGKPVTLTVGKQP